MDLINHLALGLATACAPANLLYALGGCLLGTLVGVVPGIGPLAAMAMLLPVTYAMAPLPVLILLAGVYCGAQHGVSIAAILVRPPAEPARAAAGADGLHRAGQAGAILGMGTVSALVATCVAALTLVVCLPLLTSLAPRFGPAETFALMVLGLVGAVVLAPGSLLKALAMLVLGLLLGLVGTDVDTGVVRFALDVPELQHGMGLATVAMGVFGYGPILSTLAQPERVYEVLVVRVQDIRLNRQDLRGSASAVLRGTVLGAFFSLLAVGIPSNAGMALMVGAMGGHHLQPSPQALAGNPEFFWGLMASLWLGSLLLLVLNLPLMGLWSRLLGVPYRWLFPLLLLLGALGAYSPNHSSVDIWLLAAFGLVGYVFHTLEMAPAPLLLGFVLGPTMEDYLRQALLLSQGDWSVFVMRPLSAGLLLVALGLLCLVPLPAVKRLRQRAFATV